jgi:hypothetical protein
LRWNLQVLMADYSTISKWLPPNFAIWEDRTVLFTAARFPSSQLFDRRWDRGFTTASAISRWTRSKWCKRFVYEVTLSPIRLIRLLVKSGLYFLIRIKLATN